MESHAFGTYPVGTSTASGGHDGCVREDNVIHYRGDSSTFRLRSRRVPVSGSENTKAVGMRDIKLKHQSRTVLEGWQNIYLMHVMAGRCPANHVYFSSAHS